MPDLDRCPECGCPKSEHKQSVGGCCLCLKNWEWGDGPCCDRIYANDTPRMTDAED